MKDFFLKSPFYFVLYGLLFSVLPVLFDLYPGFFNYYTVILDLWFMNPLISFLVSLLLCRYYGMIVYLPSVVGLSFLTVLFVFYDTSRYPFLVAYVLIALVGCLLGDSLYEKRTSEVF